MSELVAVACVVESSLVLAAEWPRLLLEYLSPLLKRLAEAHAANQSMLRLAFITYATADTRPTPLLSKKFFVPVQTIIKELKDEPGKYGIGQTASGGSRGMAALEGLVAAVELFDILKDSLEKKPLQPQSLNQPKEKPPQPPRLISHILHIAASPPNDAQTPLWNGSQKLDKVSWETLPSELKKRNLNLSIMNIRPIARFAELHSSAATKGVTPPWFKVRSPHTLLLTGFPAEPKVIKRPAETQSSPDSKRAKMNQPPPDPIPKATNPTPTSVPSTQPTPTIQPQVPAMPNPNNLAQPPPSQGAISQRAIFNKVQQINSEIQKLGENYNLALEQGRTDAAAQIKSVRDGRLVLLDRIKQSLAEYVRRNVAQQQSQASNGSGASSQPPSSGVPNFSASANAQDVSRGPDAQTLQQLMQNRAGGAGGPPFAQLPNAAGQGGLTLPSNMTPEMKGQMQKLMESRGIRPPQPPAFHQPQVAQQNTSPNVPGPSTTPQANPNQSTWEGELTWNGVDVVTQTPKNMQTQVKLTSTSGDIMPSTWPVSLTLSPSTDHIVGMPALQFWAKRTKALLCTFQAHARSIDAQSNERNFRALIELLSQKKIYALAAWTLPSGMISNNLLIFPFTGTNGANQLVGTAFPTTGIPEMPKQLIPPLPPHIQSQLQRLTPDQRAQAYAKMFKQFQQQQQQQQSQSQAPPQFQQSQPSPFNMGAQNFGSVGTFNSGNLQGSAQPNNAMNLFSQVGGSMLPANMGLQPNAMGLHHRTPSGNLMPQSANMNMDGMNPDILQSFMARRQS